MSLNGVKVSSYLPEDHVTAGRTGFIRMEDPNSQVGEASAAQSFLKSKVDGQLLSRGYQYETDKQPALEVTVGTGVANSFETKTVPDTGSSRAVVRIPLVTANEAALAKTLQCRAWPAGVSLVVKLESPQPHIEMSIKGRHAAETATLRSLADCANQVFRIVSAPMHSSRQEAQIASIAG